MTVKDLKELIKDAPDQLEIRMLASSGTLDCAERVEDAIVVTNVYTESFNYMGLYLFGK